MSSNDPIQQVINSVQQPAGAFPLEVAIPGSPQVFRGNTPQEVLNQLVQAQTNATEAIRQARAEAAQVRQEMEGLRAQIPPPPPPNASEAEKQSYYQTWAQDPEKAFDAQLGKRLGVSPERVPEILRRAVGNSIASNGADEFLQRCPDFPQNPQSAQMMHDALASRFGASMESATADNLEVVYHDLVRRGSIQPVYQPVQGTVNANSVMPNIRGGSAPPNPVNDIMAQAQAMPLEKLKEVIDRLSAQGAR